MLNKKRDRTLSEIHFREKQLSRLDYLRHNIQKKKSESKQTESFRYGDK